MLKNNYIFHIDIYIIIHHKLEIRSEIGIRRVE